MALSDQQVTALLQTMQQAVQILQSGAGADDSAVPEDGAMTGDPTDPNMMADDGDEDDADPTMGDAVDPTADPTMGGMPQPGLHDRVEQLETHTGLKKAATASMELVDRVGQLEMIHLGQEYGFGEDDNYTPEEELAARIANLEATPRLSKALAKAAEPVEAPDQIDLSAMIEAAVAKGVQRGREDAIAEMKKAAEVTQTSQALAPDLGQLRSVGSRRAAASKNLEKSAAPDLSDLSFGQALIGINELSKRGITFADYDSDDDSDDE